MKNYLVLTLVFAVALGGLFLLKSDGNKSNLADAQAGVNTSKQITLTEVSKHNQATDCWMAIDGVVYNVTSYIPNHPGGEAIVQGCGIDATDQFNSIPKHGGRATAILPNYQIGILVK